jgi:hypothetical protein
MGAMLTPRVGYHGDESPVVYSGDESPIIPVHDPQAAMPSLLHEAEQVTCGMR